MSVELRSRLQSGLGIKLSSTFAFDYSNVEDVTAYLSEALFSDESDCVSETASVTRRELVEVATDEADGDLDASIAGELAKLEAQLDQDR